MAVSRIPVVPARSQRFEITLNDTLYGMRLMWNRSAGAWMLDIYDAAGGRLLMGMPLVTGTDLLGQFEYLGIGKNDASHTIAQLMVMTYAIDKSPDTIPTYENLGRDGFLYLRTVSNV